MNIPFLTNFFNNQNNKTLQLPQSLIIKELKKVVEENNLHIFQNITIYHHQRKFLLHLIIVDETRGIFLFEYKDWSYDELKNAKIEKAMDQESKKDTLAFQKSHHLIRRKFNELVHNNGVPIFNYLLMENLNQAQYQNLDKSFQDLLPQEKIMFNDSSKNEILKKLMETKKAKKKLLGFNKIMGTLFIQYGILDSNKNIYFATQEQRDVIDSPLSHEYYLSGFSRSGRTSVLLLKAIIEKLKNPNLKILIIKPTILACDILKKKLLETIEHAIVELDITTIEVYTPNACTKKILKTYDLIICDDMELYSPEFIKEFLSIHCYKIITKHIKFESTDAVLTKSFANKSKLDIFQTNSPLAKVLHILVTLLDKVKAKNILIVSSSLNKEKLHDDLKYFIKDKAVLLNSYKNLIDQDLNTLLLSTYDDINSLEAKHVVLLDIESVDEYKLKYACTIAKKKLHVIYKDECENLNLIRSYFENRKN